MGRIYNNIVETVGRTPLVRPLWSMPGRHVVGLRGQGLARFAEPA